MNKVVKNSLIIILITILVFVIIYFVYDLIKVKPINMEQAKQNNTNGINEGLDTNKLFENVDEESEEGNAEIVNNNTEVLNGTISSKEDKAVELAKKEWGSADGVYFSNMGINSKGNYIVTVNDSNTSKTLAFYEIDVENETVKER